MVHNVLRDWDPACPHLPLLLPSLFSASVHTGLSPFLNTAVWAVALLVLLIAQGFLKSITSETLSLTTQYKVQSTKHTHAHTCTHKHTVVLVHPLTVLLMPIPIYKHLFNYLFAPFLTVSTTSVSARISLCLSHLQTSCA